MRRHTRYGCGVKTGIFFFFFKRGFTARCYACGNDPDDPVERRLMMKNKDSGCRSPLEKMREDGISCRRGRRKMRDRGKPGDRRGKHRRWMWAVRECL